MVSSGVKAVHLHTGRYPEYVSAPAGVVVKAVPVREDYFLARDFLFKYQRIYIVCNSQGIAEEFGLGGECTHGKDLGAAFAPAYVQGEPGGAVPPVLLDGAGKQREAGGKCRQQRRKPIPVRVNHSSDRKKRSTSIRLPIQGPLPSRPLPPRR